MKTTLLLTLFTFCNLLLQAQNDIEISKDITYAEVDGKKLQLDIYKPKVQKEPYLVVWVHGGAWNTGSKANPPLGLLPFGYALASVDFRASTEKPFPADVHDIKAAIRFLRANASKYGYKSDKIIIWGSSSGGHLAALVATTNNNATLEGNLGSFLNTSSSVQACIDFFGPTNFLTILNQSTPHGLNVRLPALAILLGKPLDQVTELAKLASPVYQVDTSDPPLFIVHGEQDIQVPINQSIELMSAYKSKNLKVQIEFIPYAGHSDPAYAKKELMEKIDRFLKGISF
ncbi:alpha/beta hydrolase fold domain-containing protein [Emticicia sp.]|uniref:alpha/beta hydrolase fold domain-containing protein n=1 Tax=Emticicia sp. TaxID=1930953 RepID=UPI00374FE416